MNFFIVDNNTEWVYFDIQSLAGMEGENAGLVLCMSCQEIESCQHSKSQTSEDGGHAQICCIFRRFASNEV